MPIKTDFKDISYLFDFMAIITYVILAFPKDHCVTNCQYED